MASFSILINGSPSGTFQSSKGFRQGDPLPRYLFVIATEAFRSLIERATAGNYVKGWKIGGRGREGHPISHLFFAYDTFVFYEANEGQSLI